MFWIAANMDVIWLGQRRLNSVLKQDPGIKAEIQDQLSLLGCGEPHN